MLENPNARFTVFRKGTKSVVRPPSDRASKSAAGKVDVKNKTGEPLLVSMPAGVFDSGGSEPDSAKVYPVDRGGTLSLKVHEKALEGVYDFQIFSQASFSFAQANSDPEFIID